MYSESGRDPGDVYNIPVPKGDTTFDPTGKGNVTMKFWRSRKVPGTGTFLSSFRYSPFNKEKEKFLEKSSMIKHLGLTYLQSTALTNLTLTKCVLLKMASLKSMKMAICLIIMPFLTLP